MNKYDVICIGTGEIGRPLYELIAGVFNTLAIDPVEFPENEGVDAVADILHICIPGNLPNYDDIIEGYLNKYNATQVYLHGTVLPGTTKRLNEKFFTTIFVNSPVHGKHHGMQMKKDMLRFKKYVGFSKELPQPTVDKMVEHLRKIGFGKVVAIRGTENTEWLKILSTTYFGLVIAWAQEVERICDKFGLDYETVTDIYKHQEDIIPPHFAGQIGGHCVLPNIEIIKSVFPSIACDFIKQSNSLKILRDGEK